MSNNNSQKIVEFILSHNLSHEEASTIFGVSIDTIHSWFYRRRNPSKSILLLVDCYQKDCTLYRDILYPVEL